MSVRLRIDPAVAKRFPGVGVGWLAVDDLSRFSLPARLIAERFAAARRRLADEGIDAENLAREPRIAAWRAAIGRCGLKPSTYRSSPEQLGRRLLRGGEIRTPLPVVDLYCALSAAWLAPLGAYDLDRLPDGEIALRLGDPAHDRFSPLGAPPEAMPIGPDVVVYACGREVLCYAFNHRDSRRTCLTPESRRAVFVGEATDGPQAAALSRAFGELAEALAEAGVETRDAGFVAARSDAG